jgi:hypothetical protein
MLAEALRMCDTLRADATADRISFTTGLIPNTMRWTNRSTFQQVLELDAPRAKPRRPGFRCSGTPVSPQSGRGC